MAYEPHDDDDAMGFPAKPTSASWTVRHRIFVVLLLAVPIGFLGLALARPAWRELYTTTASLPGVTFQGVRVGPLEICLRNRVDLAVVSDASLAVLDGEHCYAMRKPTRVPWVNTSVPNSDVALDWDTFAMCDTQFAMDSLSDNVDDASLLTVRDALEGLAVPEPFLSDTATLVNVACVYLPLVPVAIAFAAAAITCFLTTLYMKPSPVREGLEIGAGVLAAGSGVLLVANLVLWKSKAAAFGVSGGSMYLALTACLMLFFVAAVLVVSSRHNVKRRLEQSGEDQIQVSPGPTERLV